MHLAVEMSIQPAASTTRIYHPRMPALDAGLWMRAWMRAWMQKE
jgi:hypothetical protein